MDAQQTLSEFLRAPPVKTAAHLLFERLPDRLFSVLASPIRRQIVRITGAALAVPHDSRQEAEVRWNSSDDPPFLQGA